ncbi:hypothetical protein FRC03_010679 [Tulasnella sp. 419]|nr:hypothetical protein FRC02_009322 [Tulasnella sp. 418]KAG8967124.1 hypothetical protein FRC03_010679 [Tulasnella sp. 419]
MSSDKFSSNETYFSFEWPSYITGLERIALTCKGDLQRTLSAYFGKPIKVERIWEHPASGPVSSATPENPVTQVRQVHLLCEGVVVCVCVSTITMTNPYTAGLFLDDRVAIGQMYRTIGRTPAFTLKDVGVEKTEDGVEQLWRKYTLFAEGFECEIKETFPDRNMFASDSWGTHVLGNIAPVKQEVEPIQATVQAF